MKLAELLENLQGETLSLDVVVKDSQYQDDIEYIDVSEIVFDRNNNRVLIVLGDVIEGDDESDADDEEES